MEKKLTIRDIAAACGVTTATVSRVINNQPGVRKEIRKFVQQHIEQVGWRCSSLKTRFPKPEGAAKTVLILCNLGVLNGGGRYSMQETLQILVSRLEGEGIVPFVVFGKIPQMLEECRRTKPYAVILFTKNPWLEDAIRRLVKAGVRVLAAYGDEFRGSCPLVRSDYEAAVRKATRKLRALGCRRLGFFVGNGMFVHPKSLDDITQYWVRCIALSLERHMPGFSMKRDIVSDCFGAPEELRRMLKSGEYDGWLCCEHSLVERFCREAEELGIRVPEKLPLIAFGTESHGYNALLRVDHFVSQVEVIAEHLFQWVMGESFPEPEEVVVPYLCQKGSALPDESKLLTENKSE